MTTIPDGAAPPPTGGGGAEVIIFNRFMVDIDKPGEYDRRKMLCSDDAAALGIWGPFPMWSKRHYIACKVRHDSPPSSSGGGVGVEYRGFKETDALLFRLPRIPFTQSTPTSAEQRAESISHP